MVSRDVNLEQLVIRPWHLSARKSKALSKLEEQNPILPMATQCLVHHLTAVHQTKGDDLLLATMSHEVEEKETVASHYAANVFVAQKPIT